MSGIERAIIRMLQKVGGTLEALDQSASQLAELEPQPEDKAFWDRASREVHRAAEIVRKLSEEVRLRQQH